MLSQVLMLVTVMAVGAVDVRNKGLETLRGPPSGPPSGPPTRPGGPAPPSGRPTVCGGGPYIGPPPPLGEPCAVFRCYMNFWNAELQPDCHTRFNAGSKCAKHSSVKYCERSQIEEAMGFFQSLYCGCKENYAEECLRKIVAISVLLAKSPSATLSQRRVTLAPAEYCAARIDNEGLSTEGCEFMFPKGGHYKLIFLDAWANGCNLIHDLFQKPIQNCGYPVKPGCSGGEREIEEFLTCAQRLLESPSGQAACRTVFLKRAMIKKQLVDSQESHCRRYREVQDKLSEC